MLTFPDVPEMAKSLYCYWERNIYRLVQSPFGRVSYPVIGQLSRIFVSYWLERSHVLAQLRRLLKSIQSTLYHSKLSVNGIFTGDARIELLADQF